jgi:hypothetical protein
MNDSLLSLLGPPGTPLKRVKGKEARWRIQSLIKCNGLGPDLQLRAALSLGKIPHRALLSEENISFALNLEDRVAFLLKLTVTAKLIKADVPLHAILKSLERHGTRNVPRLEKTLAQITSRWRSKTSSSELSDLSVLYFLRILVLLSRASPSQPHRRASSKTTAKNHFADLLKIGVDWAVLRSAPDSLLIALTILSAARNRMGVPLEDILRDDPQFEERFLDLTTRSIDRCEELARQNLTTEFLEWTAVLSKIPGASDALKRRISPLHSQKARFSESMQDALGSAIGNSPEATRTPIIHLAEEDSVQTVQLASALISAWVAKEEGPKAREAFEELASIAASFFGLQLQGNPGEIEEYNPRIHELVRGTAPAPRVLLLRPWVEFSRHARSKVILKASVEPGK